MIEQITFFVTWEPISTMMRAHLTSFVTVQLLSCLSRVCSWTVSLCGLHFVQVEESFVRFKRVNRKHSTSIEGAQRSWSHPNQRFYQLLDSGPRTTTPPREVETQSVGAVEDQRFSEFRKKTKQRKVNTKTKLYWLLGLINMRSDGCKNSSTTVSSQGGKTWTKPFWAPSTDMSRG